MKCPQCQFENREGAKFCKKCGIKLELTCPSCGHPYEQDSLFCDECGQRLEAFVEEETVLETKGERKHVTVLFSDLSGYTAMSEKLDPEEVKEITSRIFGEISKVIDKYGGFVEKFVGDAVMALFGVPKAHEDDPLRAIKAAREIHDLVNAKSPEVEKRIEQPISMHTGVNTGLVVTGEVDMEKGTHGVAGDTINLAARLSSLAKSGEILVSLDTYRQTEGYFIFEALEQTMVKGKAEPIQAFRLLASKERPITIHRLSGLRAELIGRKAEVTLLREAVDNLREGKGRIFSVCGGAGTGKSRLIEDFKDSLDLKEVQWLEGHAYAYSQNIPYFPLIDLLNRIFHIEESDSQERVREKVESGMENLVGKEGDIVGYVGSLYSISYPEVEDVSPEFWKSRLQEATLKIISALAQKTPTVFFLEDLHWADPSFIELLRSALMEVRQPAVVLCVYRPTISLFTSQQLSGVGKIYQEIRLQDLSLSEAQDMLESLLKTESIPSDLKRFVQEKAEGNPFYLEELVNSLIESETLIRDNGTWKTTKPISESDISSSIHGLISGRLDRLEKETKRILQEASVIGRAFLYEILTRITELEDRIDGRLSTLERLDLIKTRSLQPDMEYMFKHPLTQEVVYNGLLKKDRHAIHEQIAIVMEQLYQDRLSEFYETLAFHFTQGQSVLKAVDYLIRSAEKSLGRYAVQEAHQYYQDAFSLLTNKPSKTQEENKILIELLIKWALVYYYRGDFGGMSELFKAHKDQAKLLEDKETKGLFYAWLGFSHWARDDYKNAYRYSNIALRLGEDIHSKKLIGYACTFIAFACCELGFLDQAISYGKRAHEIGKTLGSDHYLFFKPLWAVSTSYVYMGQVRKNYDLSEVLLAYGRRHSNIRCLVVGHVVRGFAHYAAGRSPAAIEWFKKGLDISADPFYSIVPMGCMAYGYIQNGEFKKAGEILEEVAHYSQSFGCEWWGTVSGLLLGIVRIAEGEMSEGLRMIEQANQSFSQSERKYYLATSEYILGSIYSQIALGEGEIKPSTMIRNIGFLVKNIPFAGKKADQHFNKAIEISENIGAKGLMGQAYLDLGLLHKAKRRTAQAIACVNKAIQFFEENEADVLLKQAREALKSLKQSSPNRVRG